MQQSKKTKVLVVDDSALMRKLISLILSRDKNIEVVGTAMDGDFALRKIPQLMPDVITLDIDMPRMNGLEALRVIVNDFGIPVIMVSSHTYEGAETTIRGLELGAFDFVSKPKHAISLHIHEIANELIAKIKAASKSKVIKIKEKPVVNIKPKPFIQSFDSSTAKSIVAIGISTGGPQSLIEILPNLPSSFPYGILIVQHMPEKFTELFAKRLDSICNISVKEASSGDVVRPGLALLAPGGRHLKVKKTPVGAVAVLSSSKTVSGYKPSATVLFNSVAEEYGNSSIGVIMTGMGEDGVEGLKKIKEKGGFTIAQNEDTSIVFGMPKVAIETGCVDRVLGLHEIVPYLITMSDGKRDVNVADKNSVQVLN